MLLLSPLFVCVPCRRDDCGRSSKLLEERVVRLQGSLQTHHHRAQFLRSERKRCRKTMTTVLLSLAKAKRPARFLNLRKGLLRREGTRQHPSRAAKAERARPLQERPVWLLPSTRHCRCRPECRLPLKMEVEARRGLGWCGRAMVVM